jgi:hypothetical protein
MRKKYLTLIVVVAFAFILNSVVLGILVSQPTTPNNDGTTNFDNPTSKISVSVIPTYPPHLLQTPLARPALTS